MTEKPIERVRRLCLSWPDVTERLSHGKPTWFHRDKRSFATGADRHHDDRVAFWCAAPVEEFMGAAYHTIADRG